VRQADMDSGYLFGNARSGNCVFLLLVLVLFNGRHVTIMPPPIKPVLTGLRQGQ
jgi:hypothetical protein